MLLELIHKVEGLSNKERASAIKQILTEWDIPFATQPYSSGENIICHYSKNKKHVGVSCHFDVVPGSPGANDNGSSIAVALGILQRLEKHSFKNFNVTVFFFDEEETGLHGSRAWIKENGIANISSLINLEMLGMGDQFALWSLGESAKGIALETFERTCDEKNIPVKRFDRIVTNIADHMTFREAGLEDSFSVTCISDKEIELSIAFYNAMKNEAAVAVLKEIMRQAPLFVHYHKPTDQSIHLNETSLKMAEDTVWQTLLNLDKR